ncbi:hypothetical protein PF005_g15146 [Phytophthora fragariae]|uniref:Uncharacterized protein n=2 Tax=Phytophthora TaxID=4783 RepID=A0A6A3LV98_9STRA|nr:hypothetical protein PF003_g11569 [Phytophthora fragariae]KAE8997877.1 hypothetical protein PR001_g19468 [Phytophthora rubi]KAE8906756.1 hypothetical protein PF003_g8821 [Phytophthora fragariae]KAE8922063.1 hypothetical protein PF009_g27665 [Phytophthora fragariae]KAE8940449.1 hypothetical protein PF009_g9738 [Phytophthora fragariae]
MQLSSLRAPPWHRLWLCMQTVANAADACRRSSMRDGAGVGSGVADIATDT